MLNNIYLDSTSAPLTYQYKDFIYEGIGWLWLRNFVSFKKVIQFYFMSEHKLPDVISIGKLNGVSHNNVVNWYKDFCSDLDIDCHTMILFHDKE